MLTPPTQPRPIPLYDVVAENKQYAAELRAAFERTLASGRFSGGEELELFEKRLAGYCGTKSAIGVKSGTDALVLSLLGLGIGPGDEVITSAFTFIATAEAILQVGALPVFADIDPNSLCITAQTCTKVLSKNTKAILAVHVYGHCSDMGQLSVFCQSHGIWLIEDAAQAIGATWHGRKLGSIGDVGTFSFYPTKNLSTLGNGGAIVTANEGLAERIRSLQAHGREHEAYTRIGYSSHLDELLAAFLNVKLRYLEEELARRRQIAARYDVELASSKSQTVSPTAPSLSPVIPAAGCRSNYHQYAIRSTRRDQLRRFLSERGIDTGNYYSRPLHQEPVMKGRCRFAELAETEKACSEVLTLPVRPSLTDDEVATVIAAVREFHSS